MHYTVYKTTNKLNGKCYIGTHKTKDLNDGYLGSGTILKRAIEKHGEENFTKEILFDFDNPAEMFAKEAELVNPDYLMNENTYNLKVGGFGGFDYLNSEKFNNPTHSRKHGTKCGHVTSIKYQKDSEYRSKANKCLELGRMVPRVKKITDEDLLALLIKHQDKRSPVRSSMKELNCNVSGGLARRAYRLYQKL